MLLADHDRLLAALDQDPGVHATGRSAVVRAAVGLWLRSRESSAVDAAYRKGYGASGGLGPDWSGWSEKGEWPAE